MARRLGLCISDDEQSSDYFDLNRRYLKISDTLLFASEYKGYKEFYNGEVAKVIEFCKKNDIIYHIKEGIITK